MKILSDSVHEKGVCLLSVVEHRAHIRGDQLTVLPDKPNILLTKTKQQRKVIDQLWTFSEKQHNLSMWTPKNVVEINHVIYMNKGVDVRLTFLLRCQPILFWNIRLLITVFTKQYTSSTVTYSHASVKRGQPKLRYSIPFRFLFFSL